MTRDMNDNEAITIHVDKCTKGLLDAIACKKNIDVESLIKYWVEVYLYDALYIIL
jgi:hypothetical protein